MSLIVILYRPNAVYWGDSNDNGLYLSDLDSIESGTSRLLFTGPVSPNILFISADRKWAWFTGGIENTAYRADLPAGPATVLDNGYSDIDGIFFAESTGILYISDSGSSTIYSATADWTSHTMLGAPVGPRGLFIDSRDSKLYLADNTQIIRSELDFSGYTPIVATAGDPRDLEMDSDRSLIFWTDQTGGAIRKAGTDGSGDTQIASGLNSPFGIALDTANQWVYYCETGTNSIGRIKYDGSSQQMIFSGISCWDLEIARSF
tara:strand:+ start:4260 stop:5045 length:786 start_codon:yes stop_codon:yes gene_type:complete